MGTQPDSKITRCDACGNDKIVKAHCNTCSGKRNHRLLAMVEHSDQTDVEDYGQISWRYEDEMLQCLGCEHTKLRTTTNWSEDPEPSIEYFPPVVFRQRPKWLSDLPWRLERVMSEIYSALAADSRILALIGARTATDMATLEKVGNLNTFKDKLDALESKGLVSQQNRQFLEATIEAGNAAAHRGHLPNPSDVNHAMDIVENLLESIYVLPPGADKLKKSTPPRRKAKARKT